MTNVSNLAERRNLPGDRLRERVQEHYDWLVAKGETDEARKYISTVRALHTQARTDGHTQVLNKDGFREQAPGIVAKAAQYGKPLALFGIDFDGFKGVNDERGYRGPNGQRVMGHPGGDLLIADGFNVFRQSVRAGDLVARMGGDEAVALLYDITPEEAVSMAGRLSNRFQQRTGETISIGIVAYERTPSDETLQRLINRADEASYVAKEHKDRVMKAALWTPSRKVEILRSA